MESMGVKSTDYGVLTALCPGALICKLGRSREHLLPVGSQGNLRRCEECTATAPVPQRTFPNIP